MEENHQETVFSVTSNIIHELECIRNVSSGKAMFAHLRNSIGRPLSQSMRVWSLLYEHLPETFLSKNGNITKKEQAILTTLQLYALHQQGNAESVNMNDTDRYKNMGYSLSTLHRLGNSSSMDDRFNAMITAQTNEELMYYLRQLVRLLKSRTSSKVHYPRLAEDLYGFLVGYAEDVRLRWAKAYYRTKEKGESDEK